VLWGLTLVGACVAWLLAQKLLFTVAWALHAPMPVQAYIGLDILRSIAWIVGAFLITPRSVDRILPGGSMVRLLARCSQVLWLPAGVAWLLEFQAGPHGQRIGTMMMWSWLFTIAAAIGAYALAFVLLQAAEALELDEASRRIGLTMLVAPVLAVVLTFVPLQTNFLILALTAPLLLAWAWYLLGFARGTWEMRQHVAWGIRQAHDTGDRQARIDARREELDRQASSMVRALPAPPHAPPTSPQPRRDFRRAR
jgi:hypothetical protein